MAANFQSVQFDKQEQHYGLSFGSHYQPLPVPKCWCIGLVLLLSCVVIYTEIDPVFSIFDWMSKTEEMS